MREARADELEQLPRLAEAALPGEVVAAGGLVEPRRLAEQLGGDRVFVAECDGRRAGYAAVSERGRAAGARPAGGGARPTRAGTSATGCWTGSRATASAAACWAVRVPAAGVDDRARDFYLRRGYADRGGALERELAHVER